MFQILNWFKQTEEHEFQSNIGTCFQIRPKGEDVSAFCSILNSTELKVQIVLIIEFWNSANKYAFK